MPGADEIVDGRERYLEFEITGTGFHEHNGQVVRVVTHKWDDRSRVFAADELLVVDGMIHFLWVDAYERFSYQPVLFYADVDADGRCNPAVDHVWGGPSSAWNPRGNEWYSVEIEHDVGLGGHLADAQAEKYCNLVNACSGEAD